LGRSTFGESGGAFAYGFAPINSTPQASANFGGFALPFYTDTMAVPVRQTSYIVGPGNPVVPNFRDGTQPPGFPGYPVGFTDFAATPVAGTYALTVHLGTANGNTVPDFTTSATLTSAATLGTFPTPVYVSDGAGGGAATVAIPAGVTETFVYVLDRDSGNVYTLFTRASGTQTLTLPPNIGPFSKGVAGASIPVGDRVRVYAVGFDYPALEAIPIGAAPAQTPAITGANGQADLTSSDSGDPAALSVE